MIKQKRDATIFQHYFLLFVLAQYMIPSLRKECLPLTRFHYVESKWKNLAYFYPPPQNATFNVNTSFRSEHCEKLYKQWRVKMTQPKQEREELSIILNSFPVDIVYTYWWNHGTIFAEHAPNSQQNVSTHIFKSWRSETWINRMHSGVLMHALRTTDLKPIWLIHYDLVLTAFPDLRCCLEVPNRRQTDLSSRRLQTAHTRKNISQ